MGLQASSYKNRNILRSIFLLTFFMLYSVPSVSCADEQKTIVLLESLQVPVVLEHSTWFLDELEILGYKDGVNATIIRLDAGGERQKARNLLLATLKETRPDLVVTNATLASQEAKPILEKENIPQLFFTVSSPVDAGLVKAMGEATGTNITGKSYSLAQKAKIENLFQFIGQLDHKRPFRFGLVYSSYPSAVSDYLALSAAVLEMSDISFIPLKIVYREGPEGLSAMLDEARNGVRSLESEVDFWWHPQGPLGELEEYAAILEEESSHPVVVGTTLESIKTYGALLYMSPDRERYGRETARLAVAILSGTDPGSIPPAPPADFLLAFNLQTALDLNIVVPSEMFLLAGEHVYK